MKAIKVRQWGDIGPRQWLAALALVAAAHLFVVDWLAGVGPASAPPAAMRIIEASLLAPPPGPAPGATAPADEPAQSEVPETEAPDEAAPVAPVPDPVPEPQPLEATPGVEPEPRLAAPQPASPAPPKAQPQPTARPRARAKPTTVPAERASRGHARATVTDGANGPAAGGPATAPRHDAAYLNNPPPAYPLAARRRGVEGKVLILAQVAATGECVAAAVSRSSGHAILDEAALAAVHRWRFVSARRGGRNVAAAVEIPIVFRLDD